ncbi:pectin acetylesterase 8-like [Lycium barbarum]|uniref:pectin acetylesterase 8-like n=1 Tax=Lycium barbarum TaxID=112863 RepID=UPI00293E69D4|nr:pectin acetylesterase 8-like [Lycium barbarum]
MFKAQIINHCEESRYTNSGQVPVPSKRKRGKNISKGVRRVQIDFKIRCKRVEKRQNNYHGLSQANRVKVKYCDGSSFTGDIEEVDPATNLHYRGARIFKVIVEELLAKGMSSAQNVILSGTSAGGLAAILNCDKFKNFLQMDTRLKCISDAGFFLNVNTIAGKPEIKELYERVVVLHGSTKNLPASCTSTLKPSLCFFPQYVAGYIQTPLFIINSAYDSWQVNNSLVPEDADPQGIWNNCKKNINECSPSQLNILHGMYFLLKFFNAITELGGTSSIGYFIISCHYHNIIERQSYWFYNNSPTLSNKTIATTVGDWFYEESVFQNTDCPCPCGQKFCHKEQLIKLGCCIIIN